MKQLKLQAMVDYHYDDNTNKKRGRQRMFRSVLAAVIATVIIVVGYIIYDSLSSSTLITEAPPATSTLGQQAEQSVFENDYFRLVADDSWQEAPPTEEGITSFRFQSFERDLIRRTLIIYVNGIPSKNAITHVLPVEADGNKVISHTVSPHCRELQQDKDNRRDIEMTWSGVQFLCDPDFNAYLVGSSHPGTGHNLQLGGNSFFFLYRDSEPVGRLEIFPRLLSGFEAK